jgi:hypothetical protein
MNPCFGGGFFIADHFSESRISNPALQQCLGPYVCYSTAICLEPIDLSCATNRDWPGQSQGLPPNYKDDELGQNTDKVAAVYCGLPATRQSISASVFSRAQTSRRLVAGTNGRNGSIAVLNSLLQDPRSSWILLPHRIPSPMHPLSKKRFNRISLANKPSDLKQHGAR